jgi:FG-GAP repeat protein
MARAVASLPRSARLAWSLACLAGLAQAAAAQGVGVRAAQRIDETTGGFGGSLAPDVMFGTSVAALGDVDGDGVTDLAVGAWKDPTGGSNAGAVWVLFLRADGTVRDEKKITEGVGGGVNLPANAYFGSGVEALGDLDGDGTPDLAVGAMGASALWVMFLNPDGTVRATQKIAANVGGFTGNVSPADNFGESLGALGDLDGDGVVDLAVGAPDDGPDFQGAVWILFLQADGRVKGHRKIDGSSGGFGVTADDQFGSSAASVGDLDGDGIVELAVGARGEGNGAFFARGAVWILFLRSDGSVRASQKVSSFEGGFTGVLRSFDYFGRSVAGLGDIDRDGTPDLAVGAPNDDHAGSSTSRNFGAVWLLFLLPDGRVKSYAKIAHTSLGGELEEQDWLGYGLHAIGDLDGNGVVDLASGAPGHDTGDSVLGNEGSVWVLFLEGPETCFTLDFETEDDFTTPLGNGQHVDTEFGRLVTLTSSGPNAGLALFDSSVGGPNDPSQDPDLLVGSGNVLILQTENLPPDANDVFPRPNDDEDGGTITFDFALPVEPRSVRLIDVDAGDGTSTFVATDGLGRRRTHVVPRDWTGDRTLGQPGEGTLDLGSLAAQPGFGASATASEDPGFDPFGVVRLEVHWSGSGALDDLAVCSASLPRAVVRLRNGSGANPRALTAASLPVLGASLGLDLDCSGSGSGLALVALRDRRVPATASPFGEVLIGGVLLDRAFQPAAAASNRFTWSVPRELALCGLALHAQGLCRQAPTAPAAGKTLHARARLSNALELVLGF